MTISAQRSPMSTRPSTTACCVPRWLESFVSFAIVTHWSPMRSRWRPEWRIARTRRRSLATGVWRASTISTCLLEREVALVDLVVERDHLVAELDVLRPQGVDGAADRPEDDLAGLLEARLERVQLGLQLDSHPNRPVT